MYARALRDGADPLEAVIDKALTRPGVPMLTWPDD